MSPADVMWWATYNAALTGLLANGKFDLRFMPGEQVVLAVSAANEAHGFTPKSYKGD